MKEWEDMVWYFVDKVPPEGPYAKYSKDEVGYSWEIEKPEKEEGKERNYAAN